MRKYFILIVSAFLLSSQLYSRENVEWIGKRKATYDVQSLASGCSPGSAATNLDINNVRARIMNGGDMWWDLVGQALYEVPKVTEAGETRKTSLFAGALWIGGYDPSGNLRAAAMTYRQQNSWDFFPGPLDPATSSITESDCSKWDKIFQVNREEIEDYEESGFASGKLTDNIREWPGYNPGKGITQPLAPFIDGDNDGVYNPEDGGGDYPDVYGDQTLWFVYNDKGNTHTETGALAIGLQVQTQAFAFATNDEINNMTFYEQKIINRAKSKLEKVYFGQWVDADLGYAYDDYVACDTNRGLGICYNGDDFDEGAMGYGNNPPSVGVDFFQGPLGDDGEEILMSKFVYYNNDWSTIGNPSEGIHYYYYLTGRWKNGAPIRYGGNGTSTNPSGNWGASSGQVTNYMFPADPRQPQPSWSEKSSGNNPGDRRFIQSAGPFTLNPGAVNYVTVGVVWARASSGGNTGSYDLLLLADDKAQKLYNNNFKLIDGPDAPDIEIQELDRELILSLEKTVPIEKYYDSVLNESDEFVSYKFQGYLIYQLKNASVTTAELDDPDKARLAIRVDIVDGVNQVVNRVFDPVVSAYVPKQMVDDQGDNGIRHTFNIKNDLFSSGDDRLVNFKSYYYLILSYATTDNPFEYEQFLAGRRNVNVYTGIPHKTDIRFDGIKLGSKYGDGPIITRIEGTGNGGKELELTQKSEMDILTYNFIPNPVYKRGKGPLNIFVYDPIKVPDAEFEFKVIDSHYIKNDPNPENFAFDYVYGQKQYVRDKATWALTELGDHPKTVFAEVPYGADYEQIIPEWGLSVKFDRIFGPTIDTSIDGNGIISASINYDDIAMRWLVGVPDGDHSTARGSTPLPQNWIRSGKFELAAGSNDPLIDDAKHEDKVDPENHRLFIDPTQIFEKMFVNGGAPYGVVARSKKGSGYFNLGPAYENSLYKHNELEGLNSIDLVFTDRGTTDKKFWTQCIVLEMGEDDKLNEGGAKKHFLRDHYSWTGQVDNSGKPIYSTSEKGRSWFPGYAINIETGERLNIVFSEDSYLEGENGRDMIWNPNYNYINPNADEPAMDRFLYGGKHYIYVMSSRSLVEDISAYQNFEHLTGYDGGAEYHEFFTKSTPSVSDMRKFYSSAMYTFCYMVAYPHKLKPLKEGLIPTETRVKIRIAKPYAAYRTYPYDTFTAPQNNNLPLYRFSTKGIAMAKSETYGENAMEKINIVPNPYYGSSEYERNQLDNRVRIINLPRKCEVKIFTLSGNLVRKYNKDESETDHQTFLDWDLKNHAGIPVASGLYIIHIDGFKLGTKTLKWFGIMRPIDLDTF
jgi:hypothetical protein